LAKADGLWENRRVWGKWNKAAVIKSVIPLGEREVIAIGTTTNTFIAEGFLSHNCKLEAILQGWLAHEDKMVDYFLNEPNGYIKIGKDLFGKEVKEDTPDYRLTKSIVLGVNYNMKVWKLAHDLWTVLGIQLAKDWEDHVEAANKLLIKYHKIFPKLSRYIRRCGDEALRTGKVEMLLGYQRRLPLPPEPPRSEKEEYRRWKKQKNHVLNEAANCKAQHLASLVTGTAMLDVERRFLDKYNLTYVQYHELLMYAQWKELNMPLLINEVHDDLIYDMPTRHRKANMTLIKETMQELPTLRKMIPDLGDIIRVDQQMAPSWALKT
jgi:DNA polymerase I-like protein with 3'-5' exonuclease and polymerase domains